MTRIDRPVVIQPQSELADEGSSGALRDARAGIAKRLDDAQIQVRVQSGAEPISAGGLLQKSDAELQEMGIDAQDLWSLLSDVDVSQSGEGLVDISEGSQLSHRYLLRDGQDSNYHTATTATPSGTAHVAESLDVSGKTDGQQPGWFQGVFQVIAEFFVELFSSEDYITSRERDEQVGESLAEQHPETLRALLDSAEGRRSLQQQLFNQRPEGTPTDDWESNTSTGAVYAFTLNEETWSQQAYIKASNSGH